LHIDASLQLQLRPMIRERHVTHRCVFLGLAFFLGVVIGWLASVLAFQQQQRWSMIKQRPAPLPKTVGMADEQPMLKWQDYSRLADLIASLPVWGEELIEKDAWRSIIRVAHAFQQLDPRDVECALLVYMTRFADLHVLIPDPDPRTRPLLLLRVMFLVLDDYYEDEDYLTEHMGFLAGGYVYQARDDSVHDSLALPVRWSHNGPELSAFRMSWGTGYTGPADLIYQPHNEYRYFRDHFDYRDLSNLGGGPVWRELFDALGSDNVADQ
jgi:hypothetical protein